MALPARPSVLPRKAVSFEKVCENVHKLASKLLKMAFVLFSQMHRDQQLIDLLTGRIRYCDAFLAAVGLLMLSATPTRRQELCRIAHFVNRRRELYEKFRLRLSMC